jgi:hypothetical protein
MLDYQQVGPEKLCIRCVSDAQVALATPTLAGAIAVLRTLWVEAEIERQTQCERPFPDRRRLDAIRETGEIVLWWLTPKSLRPPNMATVGESTILDVLREFDRIWKLRCSSRSLADVYAWWVGRHAKVLRYRELTAIDRRYAALIASEPARSAITAGQGEREAPQ